jgi:hypothetical protein
MDSNNFAFYPVEASRIVMSEVTNVCQHLACLTEVFDMLDIAHRLSK